MNKFASAALLLLSATSLAQAALPVGSFGHEFTKDKNDKVFTIAASGKAYSVKYHGDGTVKAAAVWSAGQRRAFWEKMGWEAGTESGAECIGAADEVFCYLPPATRKAMGDFKDYTTDFFHYDQMGGIMKIHPIGAKPAKSK